eukprot:TRINITY_DN5973_c0_g1_i1.p1 TRINITY_DN5973_c0_g1~~TRINITY_DN5973_c0_g1_i1.p1  ORF type:complete len:173 (-),score=23.04 TRINITY_DN5973_c0_g1_i1:95-613(-)
MSVFKRLLLYQRFWIAFHTYLESTGQQDLLRVFGEVETLKKNWGEICVEEQRSQLVKLIGEVGSCQLPDKKLMLLSTKGTYFDTCSDSEFHEQSHQLLCTLDKLTFEALEEIFETGFVRHLLFANFLSDHREILPSSLLSRFYTRTYRQNTPLLNSNVLFSGTVPPFAGVTK